MDNYETIPQHSSIPLNLLYKGVFSTRINSKRKSTYGHYLDKLYRIQFLGIGTYGATIEHDLIRAVMVKHTSLQERVDDYLAAPDKYSESLILEALGGTASSGLVGGQDLNLILLADRKESTSPASVVGLLSTNLKRTAEVINELRYAKKAHIGHKEQQDLAKRLEEIKDAGILEVIDLKKKLMETGLPVLEFAEEDDRDGTEDRVQGLTGTVKIRMAEELFQRTADRLNLKDKTIIVAGAEVAEAVTRKADVLVETLGTIERIAKQALIENIPGLSATTNKEAAILHYVLMQEDQAYRKSIDSIVREIIVGNGVRYETVVEVIEELRRTVLEKGMADGQVAAARYTLKKFREDLTLQFDSTIRQVGDDVRDRILGVKNPDSTVNIEFDHEVKADDTKGYIALLDTLYKDFVRFSKKADELSPKFYGIGGADNETVIFDTFLGHNNVNNQTEVSYDYYSGLPKSVVATVSTEFTIANKPVLENTAILTDVILEKVITKQGSELETFQGEIWSDVADFVGDSRDEEIFAELTSPDSLNVVGEWDELISAELTDPDTVLTVSGDVELFGELTSEPQPLVPDYSMEVWGELSSETPVLSPDTEQELFGELTSEPEPLQPEFFTEIVGDKVAEDNESKVDTDYDIAVLGCTLPEDWRYRRRPDLEPDPMPEDPLFEWICTEGYVCDDWLIVPLKDFNFENPEDMDGFYDPETFEPYFPTGQTDENGDPFVLPPYSVLNEPISNGADVGGKEPMAIDPCNLYSFIEYTVKIYDAYRTRFQGSSPIDTISRVMNMLFEQVEKLNAEWDETKGYTPDELWRIYRFIRWMALGITNRFYRVKIEYTYGDFVENFEIHPFSELIRTEGSARKFVPNYGWVLEGHPILETMQNKAYFDFKLPKKTRSSTISFELGNHVPDRPDEIRAGGILFSENFEGVPSNFKISGDGWVATPTQSGTGLGVENPARVRTYRTSTFNVPSNAEQPSVMFNYGIDTNMDTKLYLKRSDGTVVWQSSGVVTYGTEIIRPVSAGDYYFEVRVPQAEGNTMTDIRFTAQQIQDEWSKVGYQTEWKVVGEVIYEDENTPGVAMVINPQWMEDSEYEFEIEFKTEDIQENYGLIDWIGVVLNYRDPNNYYLFGTWSHLDPSARGGLLKVVNGTMQGHPSQPTWEINPDFRFKLDHWHKLRAVVNKNRFTIYIDGVKYLDVTDYNGWGYGASGLMAYSNPKSSFRNARYRGKPRFHAFIDNVVVESPTIRVPVSKPKYAIDFYLDNDNVPRIRDYLAETKRAYSFPILEGEHKAKWVFKKYGTERSEAHDASFVDNIVVRGMKVIDAKVVEEFIGCGGQLAVKLLIENLLEYYRRHHQGCKGERNIWIVE